MNHLIVSPLFLDLPLLSAVSPRIELEPKISILELGQFDVKDATERVVFLGPLGILVVEDGQVESYFIDFLLSHAILLLLLISTLLARGDAKEVLVVD